MRPESWHFYEALPERRRLLIVGVADHHYPRGVRWKERYRIDDDKYIQGLSELVQISTNTLPDIHADEP